MRVGVLSDTHVPAAAPVLPAAVFSIFQGVDLILHAGDIVELSVLEELSALAPVEAVAGNMDGPELQLRLPYKKIIPINGFQVGLIHGKYRIDIQREMSAQEFPAVDLIVYGHSHTPFWGFVKGVHFLNPGSPTDKRHAPYNSVAVLTIGKTISAEIIRV